jgi:hypothetical protein
MPIDVNPAPCLNLNFEALSLPFFPASNFPFKTHYPISLSLCKTMKGSHRSSTAPERYSNKRNGSFRRYYLKPGRLAQLRDSKIMASCQRRQLETQISVFQSLVLPTTTPSSSSSSPSGNNMPIPSHDGVPCFASRTSNHPVSASEESRRRYTGFS